MFERAAIAAARCDLFLAIGSTLTVEPGRLAVRDRRRGGRQPGHRQPRSHALRRVATAVIRDPIGEAVPQITDQLLAASQHGR